MKKTIIFIALIGILHACANKPIEVKYIGELRQIMHQGKYEGRVFLKDLPQKHLFGLGAVKELQGEILILDGKALISTVIDREASIKQQENIEATLLVYAQVPEWDTLSVKGVNDISLLLEEQLKDREVTGPTPFMLLGKAERLHYHIINFDLEKGDISQHRDGAFQENLINSDVAILGFYATDAKGIYTHHDSNIHLHFRTNTGDKAGHVDDVVFGNEPVQLLLPRL